MHLHLCTSLRENLRHTYACSISCSVAAVLRGRSRGPQPPPRAGHPGCRAAVWPRTPAVSGALAAPRSALLRARSLEPCPGRATASLRAGARTARHTRPVRGRASSSPLGPDPGSGSSPPFGADALACQILWARGVGAGLSAASRPPSATLGPALRALRRLLLWDELRWRCWVFCMGSDRCETAGMGSARGSGVVAASTGLDWKVLPPSVEEALLSLRISRDCSRTSSSALAFSAATTSSRSSRFSAFDKG